MKAMIFAAGLGTRLKPYTDSIPKALVPVAGVPMLERLVLRLMKYGVDEMIINVHHFAEQVREFIQSKGNFGIRIELSDETGELLDTGGGLKKAAWFFDDGAPFLLHNVDVFSEIDLEELISYHNRNRPLATLAVSYRRSSRHFLFEQGLILGGWENVSSNEKIINHAERELTPMAFSGIHVIDPAIFSLMTEEGRFSLIQTYIRLSKNHKIIGMEHSPDIWIDMGKIEDLDRAAMVCKAGRNI